MFCMKCGTEIPENSSLCPTCGTPATASAGSPPALPPRKPKKKLMIVLCSILAVVAIALIVILPTSGKSGAKTPEEAVLNFAKAARTGKASVLCKTMYPQMGNTLMKDFVWEYCMQDYYDDPDWLPSGGVIYNVATYTLEGLNHEIQYFSDFGDTNAFRVYQNSWEDLIYDWKQKMERLEDDYDRADAGQNAFSQDVYSDLAQFRDDVHTCGVSEIEEFSVVEYSVSGGEYVNIWLVKVHDLWYIWLNDLLDFDGYSDRLTNPIH